MKITNVSLRRFDLELSEPYQIAYETVYSATNFILQLETDTKIIGFGCAAPDFVVTKEKPEEVEEAFQNTLLPALKGANPFHFTKIMHDLKLQKTVKSSALAMVDMALYDLISKFSGVPLYKFLGVYRESIPTSVTIGILPFEETMQKAKEWINKGFFILKIKGGLDWEEDFHKLKTLRERFPKLTLRYDGNQGLTLVQALNFSKAVENLEVEIIEQPLLISEEKHYFDFSEKTSQPIMADESIKTLKDTFRLAKDNLVDMINIKLMKVGGIQEAFHINSVAKSAGYEVMVGCLDECQLGISAGLHFALSRPNIEYADLDSFLDFSSDPFKDLFFLKNGILYPNGKNGLGLESNFKF
ncbi:MAG: dipeptide epimerase [Calditrichaeota bacterium]|nr:MAG: dipeptide epimerase [Calditrichota bacterium]